MHFGLFNTDLGSVLNCLQKNNTNRCFGSELSRYPRWTEGPLTAHIGRPRRAKHMAKSTPDRTSIWLDQKVGAE